MELSWIATGFEGLREVPLEHLLLSELLEPGLAWIHLTWNWLHLFFPAIDMAIRQGSLEEKKSKKKGLEASLGQDLIPNRGGADGYAAINS